MHFSILTAALAVTSFAIATITPVDDTAPSENFTAYLDTFDTRQTQATLATGVRNGVRRYGGLYYEGFRIANSSVGGKVPTPPSEPNYIYSALAFDTYQYQLTLADKNATRFALESMYFLCTIDRAAPSKDCTVTVAGRTPAAEGGKKVVQEFVYPRQRPPIYILANFSSDFASVEQVSIYSVTSTFILALFDNIQYTVFYD